MRALGHGLALAAGLGLAATVGVGPARAQDDPVGLSRAAIDDLAQAAAALDAASRRRDRVSALTQTVRAYEDGLAALRAGLRQAIRAERTLTDAYDARAAEISRLLGVLAAIERSPPRLLPIHPSGPVDTLRAGMILADIAPVLNAEAESLRVELARLAALRASQTEAEAALAAALRGARDARAALSQAIADRTDLPRRFTADPARMAEMAAAATSLDAFARALTVLGPAAPDTRLRPGSLPLPVDGTLLRRFGEADAAGVVRPGLLLATLPAALVTAPVQGTIRYAGPLLDYGNVMILEPGADTLLVFAGLGDLYAEAGLVVDAGDPLGLMGTSGGQDGQARAGSPHQMGARRSETLYIEVRYEDVPVDPATWFAVGKQE